MLESIRNSEIRQDLSSSNATIETISDILSDFIKWVERKTNEISCCCWSNIFSFVLNRKAKENSHQDYGYPNTAYGMSKIALIAATFVQQRYFDKHCPTRDIIVNACCPGYIKTDMSSNKGTGTIEQGADTPVFLATLPSNVRSPRGEFVAERKIVKWKFSSMWIFLFSLVFYLIVKI